MGVPAPPSPPSAKSTPLTSGMDFETRRLKFAPYCKNVVTPKFASFLSQFAKVVDFCEHRSFPLRLSREPHFRPARCAERKPWKFGMCAPKFSSSKKTSGGLLFVGRIFLRCLRVWIRGRAVNWGRWLRQQPPDFGGDGKSVKNKKRRLKFEPFFYIPPNCGGRRNLRVRIRGRAVNWGRTFR